MKQYRFRNKVFAAPYVPYYDAYKGHTFVIDHHHPEDDNHVQMTCVTDPSVIVDGYVELDDLEAI